MIETEFDPYDVILQLLNENHAMSKLIEELSGNQVSANWLLSQVSSHLVNLTDTVNTLYDNQLILETRLKEYEKNEINTNTRLH